LIEVTKAAIKQAQKVKILLDHLEHLKSQQLLQKWEIFLPRIEQVVEQTSRRVLNLSGDAYALLAYLFSGLLVLVDLP
jgi:IS5 family transposase